MNDIQSRSILKAREMISTHGKTFAWADFFLSKDVSNEAVRLYSLCRILDDLADGKVLELDNFDLKETEKDEGYFSLLYDNELRDVKEWFIKLKNDLNKIPEIPNFLKKHNIKVNIFKDLIDGFIFDNKLEKVQINNEQELIIYSYQVAGTVGLMMSNILKPSNSYANKFAIDMGIAMQLTNISRDVLEDLENNRLYIPAEYLNDLFNLQLDEDLFEIPKENWTEDIYDRYEEITYSPNIKKSILRILNLAEFYYESGMKGLVYLPFKSHIAIGIAAIVYRQIGKKLRKNDINWLGGRTVISAFEKFIISFKIIPHLFKRFLKKPKHDNKLHNPIKEKLNEEYF